MPRIDIPNRPIKTLKTETQKAIDGKLANDGVVDATEAQDLVKGWSARPRNAAFQRELGDAFQVNQAKFTPEARTTIAAFLTSLSAGPVDVPGRQDPITTTPDPLPVTPKASKVQLAWDPVTTNPNGTPCTNLAGYKVVYGDAPGNYTKSVTVNDPTQATVKIENLPPGKYFFAVKAFDTSGLESGPSNEVALTLP